MLKQISVHGARQHNLKNIDVEIPRNSLTVITGLSGSGQVLAGVRHHLCGGPAALCGDAFHLRAAVSRPDGAARSGFDRRPEPGHFHRAENHQPQPAVDRRDHHRNLRLPARCCIRRSAFRIARCAAIQISRQTTEQILQHVLALRPEDRIMVMAPIVRGRKGEFKKDLEKLARQGFRPGAHRWRAALARRRHSAAR